MSVCCWVVGHQITSCLDDVINYVCFCFFFTDEIAGAGRSAGAGLQVPDIGEKCAEDSRER